MHNTKAKMFSSFCNRLAGPTCSVRPRNQTTWRLAKMNLAIRGIDASQVAWHNGGSFLNDARKDLKADFIIAHPTFNVSDWSGDLLRSDGRWTYGTPPTGNANFAWLQHFVFHIAPSGRAGVVLAKGALTSKTSGEGGATKTLRGSVPPYRSNVLLNWITSGLLDAM